ncbi:cation diffusion facilitator CzcD-associated flavoprotein CzcO [Terracoccus luteus]|uniref:Cation diffusion facilitator CzcD-associated flavoprotein CzcO n=1 Tax=Terracoccus luteus TaxID=53356 RepID=A0A495XZM3_9MICO|nr:NAD(P)/FAD-dependent oxidoreductase [Terracoccus luteus]RKT80060.1 cation diffusion facilitator CzcD-associated flavoprotein CzcO [Terracoccus luteus]
MTGGATEHLDVVVVGGGLSGVDAAYRLQTECPDRTYAVLEGRDEVGGTWSLFRYPGVRSDSDMHTLGYPFEPWTGEAAIADGAGILDYVRRTADRHGITERIRLRHKVVAAAWSSDEARWTVTVHRPDGLVRLTCSFLYLCSGYYDYDAGHTPAFDGLGTFEGVVVHPQHWPEGLDVGGRRVVVVGSGATAVTLVPELAARGADVTMLQRSPTWVMSLPRVDPGERRLRRVFGPGVAARLARSRNVVTSSAFYRLTRRWPAASRRLVTWSMERASGSKSLVSEHFSPRYDPWDQRLCLAPDGDLFTALAGDRAHVVTDTVERFTPTGIRLGSGRELPADVVVTATGLTLLIGGGIDITVDGVARSTADLVVHRGCMFDGVPNLAVCVGYVNASWTLRADLTSRYVCRLLNRMAHDGLRRATPRVPPDLGRRPLLPITSTYVRRAGSTLPQQGDRAPWLMRQSYLADRREMLHGRLDDDLELAR